MITLRVRIFAVFIALLLTIVALILVMVNRATYTHTLQQIDRQLASGYQVFTNELAARRIYQEFVTRVVAKDFALLEEIALAKESSNDAESLLVTLGNFKVRSKASFIVITTPDGQLLASTEGIPSSTDQLPFNGLIDTRTPAAVDALLVWGQQVEHVFVMPIYAPKPRLHAWLIMGYEFSNEDAHRLSQLTALEISMLQAVRGKYRVLASNVSTKERAAWEEAPLLEVHGHGMRELNRQTLVIFSAELQTPNNSPIIVLLQRSLTDALADYRQLQWQLLLLVLVALAVAAIAAFLTAGTVTRPLARIVDYVRRVGAGDYSGEAPPVSDGEIGILAKEFFAMQGDIAERERAIRHLAYHDTLTELPNRNLFRLTVQNSIAQLHGDHHLIVLIMDLDNFKDINDTLGHIAGDQLLKEVSGRLESVRRPDDQIARLGGDEFAVLISQVERHAIVPLTLHYRDALAIPFQIEGISLQINCTVGIAVYPENGENADTLLQRADVAMYVGKDNHLPYCLYNIREDRHSLLRLTLMSELKSAIERNELTLYFQPKLDLHESIVTAVECLVRWIHPRHGFIAPDDFIPMAEQTGNVRYLTTWVVDTALAQCQQWRARGLFLKVAINVSAIDLQDPALLGRIEASLVRYQLAPEILVLEITESAIMRNPERALAQLGELEALGVKISIDDFGTGYSSMAQLKHLPVHELKIDKSFVLDVANNEDDAIIVRSTVELGHNMGLLVVAEGVENAQVLELLRSYGCDWVQGFYLSKPLPVADFEAWLQASSYAPDVGAKPDQLRNPCDRRQLRERRK